MAKNVDKVDLSINAEVGFKHFRKGKTLEDNSIRDVSNFNSNPKDYGRWKRRARNHVDKNSHDSRDSNAI